MRGFALGLCVAFALGPVGSARAQDELPTKRAHPELGPLVRAAAFGFEIRVPRFLPPDTPRQPWMKKAWERGDGDEDREAVAVGITEHPALNEMAGFRRGYGPAGFVVRAERTVGDAALGDTCALEMEMPGVVVCRMHFYQRGAQCYIVRFLFPVSKRAEWTPLVAAVLDTFRITGSRMDVSVVPSLDATEVLRPAGLGLYVALPKGSTALVDDPGSHWVRAAWRLPVTGHNPVELHVAVSEKGESLDAFRTFLTGWFARQGFLPLQETSGTGLPARFALALGFAHPKTEAQRHVYLLRRAHCTQAFWFAYGRGGDVATRGWFEEELLNLCELREEPVLPGERTPWKRLGPVERDHRVGIEFRMPVGAVATTTPYATVRRSFEIRHGPSAPSVVALSESRPGVHIKTVVREFTWAYEKLDATVTTSTIGVDPILGTDAFVHLEHAERGLHWWLYFRQSGDRVWVLAIMHAAAYEAEWARLRPALVLAFRWFKVPELNLERPPAALTTETPTWHILSAAVGVARRQLRDTETDLDAAVSLVRQLTGGPAPSAPIRVHVHAEPDPVARAFGVAAGSGPAAFYYAPPRLLLVVGDKAAASDDAQFERRAAGVAAYLDAWCGTPFGVPAWIRLGLIEAANATRPARDGVSLHVRYSPLVKWIRTQRRRADWPSAAQFVDGGDTPTDEAGRAYVLALIQAASESSDPAVRDWLARYFSTLAATLDPAAAMAALQKGFDPRVLDAPARDLLKRA